MIWYRVVFLEGKASYLVSNLFWPNMAIVKFNKNEMSGKKGIQNIRMFLFNSANINYFVKLL